MVIKKDGSKELYDRQKLKRAMMLAVAKRDIETEEIATIINNLEAERSTSKNEITSKQIGDDILKSLKNVDSVAYIRFASVYKSFDDLEDFKKFVE